MKPLLAVFLLLWGMTALADDNVFRDSSFEFPAVKGRTPVAQGGDPTVHHEKQGWLFIKLPPGKDSGVTAGLTDEVAHTGKQSFFIRFNKVAKPYVGVTLTSNFIPVVSGTDYEAGIWGRTDAHDLITSLGRTVYMKLQIDFFAADASESVGETLYRVMPVPGGKDHPDFFVPKQWNYWRFRFTTPPGAVFAQMTWRWETGSDTGAVNGILFFDDVTLAGPQVPNPDMTPAPVQEETPAPDTTGSAAPQ
ncbi:MAG TPA: hypothetical protein VHY22_01795 [Chthoniobacteraceae bacterium]|jgi:hypothetical protein|nr:hypothetical protein [Chthoniobacteraceae bacterium]